MSSSWLAECHTQTLSLDTVAEQVRRNRAALEQGKAVVYTVTSKTIV